MKKLLLLFTWVAMLVPAVADNRPDGEIVRLDPAFDELVDKDAKIEWLTVGAFDWSEGPVWLPSQKAICFSDIPKNMVWKWNEKHGLKPLLFPAGYTGDNPRGGESGSNGLARDKAGNLILCQHGDRRIARWNAASKKFETLADKYDGKRFNSPNDLVIKSNGDVYFTDPPYGLEKGENDPARELKDCGVYRWSASDNKVTLLSTDLERPNGIGFSPDEKTLYVANSHGPRAIWMSFPVNDDGTLGTGKVFFDATSHMGRTGKGAPDGLKVDAKGNVFATGPGGVWVFNSSGKPLGRIDTKQATANCGFGDDNGMTLYMTADDYLCRVKLKTKGLGF